MPWIYENIRGLHFNTVLDALGGTASVSLLFAAMRKTVTYHDGFKFNEDVARSLLSSASALSREEIQAFIAGVNPRDGWLATEFRGIYYTDEENRWLHGFMEELVNTRMTRLKASLLRYLLYQACLKKRPFNLFHRANLHLRTKKNVSRSFGNAVTWERSFSHHMMQAYDELPDRACMNSGTVLASGDVSRLKPGYDLVYIDPPYVNSDSRYNRDDYWRRYHFLEGLANYKSWPNRLDRDCDIRLLNKPRWMSDWGSKVHFEDRLFSLVETHRQSQVVLSFVTNAYPSDRRIKEFFEQNFSKVSIHSRQHNHALGSVPRRELLFIGQP